ncbi:hypothetical protein ACGFR8_07820 [Streptomyces brevispora]|uniref:hypothetical protein n=1 Tax=Streptomyces brevispora TaxID=887462 RepID=UPI00371F9ABB
MNNTTAQTATVALAQVGAGRTVHFTTDATATLCERPVSRVLDEDQAAKKNKPCKQCAVALEAAATEETPAVEVEEDQAEKEARRTVSGTYLHAQDFEPQRDEEGQLLGYTFAVHSSTSTNYGWVTTAGHFGQVLEPYRSTVEEFLPVVAWQDEQVARRAPKLAEAAIEEAPAVEVEEAAAAEEAPVEEAPTGAAEAPVAGRVEVTAYTAAVDQLYLNGRDNEDRALYVDGTDVLETLPTLRRMPRWNAAEERFTVNKVALILVRDAQGDRVWVRGEADPIRVDAAGAQVDVDAPAEPGPVDMTAVLAATKQLRRRREVQRVIDNREAARAASTPTPVVEEAPTPVVEEAPTPVVEEAPTPVVEEAPAPVVEEAPAPVVEAPEAPAAGPEWRTLKGVEAPFLLYGEDAGDAFHPANDRKRCTGEPLTITRVWMSAGTRYAQDATGRKTHLWGAATRYWVSPAA